MTQKHIVKSYDEDLAKLERLVREMGGLVEEQLSAALDALVRHDPESATAVVKSDKRIDEYESKIDDHATQLLALRQPMAEDLRMIIAALRLAGNLERMGDYAKNIAKRTITLTQTHLDPKATQALRRMGDLVLAMIRDVLDAYTKRDLTLALSVIAQDRDVDRMHTSLFREFLAKMTEKPEYITSGTHLIFIAKDVERIGDHATNIAEKIHFILTGRWPEAERPKEDRATTVVVKPPHRDQNT